MQLKNQRPCELDPACPPNIADDLDMAKGLENVVVDQLLSSTVNPQAPATVFDDAGDPVAPEDLAALLTGLWADNVDPAVEAVANDVLRQGLVFWDDTYPMPGREMFLVQDAVSQKMPAPSATTIYTARDDVVPAAKALLAQSRDPAFWRASLGLFARSRTLAVYFATEDDFDAFKAYAKGLVSQLSKGGMVDTATVALFSQFDQLKLDGLTESLRLRKDGDAGSDADGPYSFARLLHRFACDHVAAVGDAYKAGLVAFDLEELVRPHSMVFVNVERHSKAKPSVVRDEWDVINQSLVQSVAIVSPKRLSKLTTMVRQARKAGAPSMDRRRARAARAAEVPFQGNPPSPKQTIARVKHLLEKLAQVNFSQNPIKVTHRTFNRPSRKDPDDYNKKGLSNATRYKPDIHVYVDTSGSISEENYRDAVIALIYLAKKLNVNLYFNSFSHVMSDCTFLQTKDRSVRQIYNQIRRTPKVTGGTDFAQIWRYVNASKERRRELSLVITDFGYYAPTRHEDHPHNLYYAPCSAMDWGDVKASAEAFMKTMRHIDPDVRRHILM